MSARQKRPKTAVDQCLSILFLETANFEPAPAAVLSPANARHVSALFGPANRRG